MDELEALRSESLRDEAMIKALDALIDAGLAGAMSWAQVHAAAEVLDMDEGEVIVRRGSRPADFAEFLIAVAKAEFTESQQHSLPIAFAAGARPWECIPLGVHGRNCHGEDLRFLAEGELLARRDGAAMIHQAFGSSAWLRRYLGLIDQEIRLRADRLASAGEGNPAVAVDAWEGPSLGMTVAPSASTQVAR